MPPAVYAARWVVPVSAPPVADGAVAVDAAGRIAYVGPREGAPPVTEELGDAVLLPGLVNAHTRLELTALRGLPAHPDPLAQFDTLTRARAELLTAADLGASAHVGVCAGLASGVTTFADTACRGPAAAAALAALGARGVVYQAVVGPDPAERPAALARLQRQVADLRAQVAAAGAADRVHAGVSPHAVHAVHEDLLLDACAWAVGERLPIAMHASETPAEIAFLRDAEGPFADARRARGLDVQRRAHSPVHLLAELGVAAVARPLLIHATLFDDSDVALAAYYDCPVALCPTEDVRRGHGVAPLRALLDAGVRVALGTGSVAANGRLDVLEEARAAVQLQRATLRRDDALTAAEALRLATLGGARALDMDAETGSLDVGKQADLAAFPLVTPEVDPTAALVRTLPGTPALLTVVAGHVVARHGRALGADPAAHACTRAAGVRLAEWRAHQPE